MNTKRKIVLVLIVLFAGHISLSGSVYSLEDPQAFYSMDYGGLLVEVEAPAIAWPGDYINLTLRAAASAQIHLNFININVSSLKGNREEVPLLSTMAFLRDSDLDPGALNETVYTLQIPKDALPGLIYGVISYSWDIKGTVPDPHHVLPKAFPATFIENKPYAELKEDYDALNGSYIGLEANYTSLQENYTELEGKFQDLESSQLGESNATGLMYLFLITTGIFVVTTIVLMIRRPSQATW